MPGTGSKSPASKKQKTGAGEGEEIEKQATVKDKVNHDENKLKRAHWYTPVKKAAHPDVLEQRSIGFHERKRISQAL